MADSIWLASLEVDLNVESICNKEVWPLVITTQFLWCPWSFSFMSKDDSYSHDKTEVQSTPHRADLVEGHCLRQNQEVFGYVWFKTTPQQSSDDTDDEPEVRIALNRMMTFEAFVWGWLSFQLAIAFSCEHCSVQWWYRWRAWSAHCTKQDDDIRGICLRSTVLSACNCICLWALQCPVMIQMTSLKCTLH